jgi:hypothetical protein
MFPDRRRICATPIRKQAGRSFETGWQVYTASGRAFSTTSEKVWIFDNEIDWVMRIRHLSLVPAVARQLGSLELQMG